MPVPSHDGVHRRSLLRDDVYRSIRDAIVDGTLAPGERLKDSDLESWLGVSRTPIREALLRLERAGLVIANPGRSTLVAPFDLASALNAQQVAASMHELAARSAVPRLPTDAVESMTLANARFEAALDLLDVEAALAADDDFHEVFVAASGNPMIREVLEQMTPVLRRVERMRFSSDAARESVVQHIRIIELALAGDADGAAKAAHQNWSTLAYAHTD